MGTHHRKPSRVVGLTTPCTNMTTDAMAKAEQDYLRGDPMGVNVRRRMEAIGKAYESAELERLRSALAKIASRWPCETAAQMSRLADETLGKPTPTKQRY